MRHMHHRVVSNFRPVPAVAFRCNFQLGAGSGEEDATDVAADWKTGCIAWRQTGGCNANGDREPKGDQNCNKQVSDGSSGFCECEGGRVAKRVGCKHKAFTCANEYVMDHGDGGGG